MWTAVGITTAISALTWLGIAYPPYAEARGWRLGQWVGGNGWYAYHGMAAISVLISGWKYGGFLGLAAVLVGGWIAAFVVIHALRSWSQMISLLSLPLALGWHWNIP